VLGANDDPKEFHTVQGLIFTQAKDGGKTPATCVVKPLGLIGFYAGHKTEFAPQWVWTTFEHFRNVPEQADVTSGKLLPRYNFYNRACDAVKCPINQIPLHPWNPAKQPFQGGFKSQIVRMNPISPDAKDINKASQAIVDGVWKNYMLVSTQWPTDFASRSIRPAIRRRPICRTRRSRPTARAPCRSHHRAASRVTTTRPPSTSLRRRPTSPSFWRRRNLFVSSSGSD
jgi:hypothetical protein